MGWYLGLIKACAINQADLQGGMEHILSLTAIRDQKAMLNRAILEAQTQLADLEVAERIVRRFGQATADERPDGQAMEDLLRRAKVEAPKSETAAAPAERTITSKAVFLSVLRQSLNPWMTANEIQERASAIKGHDVPMATVSPTLSNMKNAGLIVRDGLKVALTERLNENGALDGDATSAPEIGPDYNPERALNPHPPND